MELLTSILVNLSLGLIYGSYATLTYLMKANDTKRYRHSVNIFVVITLLFAASDIVSADYSQLLARGFMIVGVAIAPFTCKTISNFTSRRLRDTNKEVNGR